MRIAVIAPNSYKVMGGVSTYNRKLYKMFSNIDFFEYPIFDRAKSEVSSNELENVKIIKDIYKKAPFLGGGFNKVFYNKLTSEHDLVLITTSFYPKKMLKKDNVVFVQHMDNSYYDFFKKLKYEFWFSVSYYLLALLKGVGSFKSPIKMEVSKFFFSKHNVERISDEKIYTALYPSEAISNATETTSNSIQERKNYISIARLAKQKGINNLLKINDNISGSLFIYGNGKYKKKKIIKKGMYKGILKSTDVFSKITEHKALILASQHEGNPVVISEALRTRTPVFTLNSFRCAMEYKSSNNVYIFDDIQSLISHANKFEYVWHEDNFLERKMNKEQFYLAWKKCIEENSKNSKY